MISLCAPACDCAQALQVGLLVSDDAHQIDLPQFLLARRQRRRRNLDGIVISRLPPRQRFQNPSRFLAAAASQFRHVKATAAAARFLGVFLQ